MNAWTPPAASTCASAAATTSDAANPRVNTMKKRKKNRPRRQRQSQHFQQRNESMFDHEARSNQNGYSGAGYQYQRHRIDTKKQLVLSPLAYLKLKYMCLKGSSEVAGFGVTDRPDSLYVEEFLTLPQEANSAYFEFDDGAQSLYLDQMDQRGISPSRCARIWIHTHPGSSPNPSSVDESTLDNDFKDQTWAVMMIMAREGQTYARLRYNQGPGADLMLPVEIDWKQFPAYAGTLDLAAEMVAWEREYQQNIKARTWAGTGTTHAWQHQENGTYTWQRQDNGTYTRQPASAPGNRRGEVHLRETTQPREEHGIVLKEGYQVPSALWAEIEEAESAQQPRLGLVDKDGPAAGSAPVPALAQQLEPADVFVAQPVKARETTPDKAARKKDSAQSLYHTVRRLDERVEKLEASRDGIVEYLEDLGLHVQELLQYEPVLEQLNLQFGDVDPENVLEEHIVRDDEYDDSEFVRLNELRREERHEELEDIALMD